MSNPVVTYHGVQFYLTGSDYPECRELVVVAHSRGGEKKVFPGIVVNQQDREAFIDLFQRGWDGGPRSAPEELSSLDVLGLEDWKRRIIREECETNGVLVKDLRDPRKTRSKPVSRARAKIVRKLVAFVGYHEAAQAVGIRNHTSVVYWVTGKGKDRYR